MKILFITAELAPWAKVGGLADVAASLPQALQDLGHEVIIFTPGYGLLLNDPDTQFQSKIDPFFVRVNHHRFVRGTLSEGLCHGIKTWAVNGEVDFARVNHSHEIYTFHRDDYLYWSQAALEACQETGWFPDLIHCHDWHTGLIPVLLRQRHSADWEQVATLFTIHNLAYQGEFGFDTLDAAGLPHDLFHPVFVEAYGSVNFLKAGAAFADQVNTVSPNYSHEIQHPEYGCRLDGHMRHLHAHGRLHGILNGIDPEVWDPATDQVLPNNYSASNLAGKANCRSSLLQKSGLESNPHAPIFGMVTRISSQKGFDILLGAAQQILDTGSTLIVQGLGEPHLIEALRALESSHPTQVKFFELYDADLAQLVYAGSDAFLMPSAFEPCGLGQMFAMRYGTIPVVRHTGGLADTVFEDHNGFVFEDHTAEALANAIKRCVHAFSDKKYWAQLQQSGMIADYSWAKSALEYQKLYELAKSDRAQFLALAANSVSSL